MLKTLKNIIAKMNIKKFIIEYKKNDYLYLII